MKIHGGTHGFKELAACGAFPGKGFDDPDPVDIFRQCCRNFGHAFLQRQGILPQNLFEVGKVEDMQRQKANDQKCQLRTDEEKQKSNGGSSKNLFGHGNAEVCQLLKQAHITDDIADQFPGPVFLIKAQRKALQMAEDPVTHIQQHTDGGISPHVA